MNLFYFWTRSDWLIAAPALIFTALEVLLGPAGTIIIGKVMDALQEFLSGSIVAAEFDSKVLSLCTGLFILAPLSMLFGWLMHTLWSLLGYTHGHRARLALYPGLLSRDAAWIDTTTDVSGYISMAFKDIQDFELALGLESSHFIGAFVGLAVNLGVALYHSWAVTLVCVCGIPLLTLFCAYCARKVALRSHESKVVLDKLSDRLLFALGSLTTLKIFQKEDYEASLAHDMIEKERKLSVLYWSWASAQGGAARFVLLSMFVQGFYFGSHMVGKGKVSAGDVVIVFWSCVSAGESLQGALEKITQMQHGFVSATRLKRRLESEPPEDVLKRSIGIMPPIPRTPGVEFCNVDFSFPSRKELVLNNFSVTFPPGKISYVLGPSGIGKSSIAAIITKQYGYERGIVTIDTYNVAHLAHQWIEDNVYLMEQHTRLFDISICENIRIGSKDPQGVNYATVNAALRAVQADFVFSLPDGIHTANVQTLSGGQKQRILLARAWVRDAPIMIFDECTSAVEPRMQHDIMGIIQEFRKGKTTIIVTHDTALIPPNDPVIVMRADGVTSYDSVNAFLAADKCSIGLANRNSISLAKETFINPNATLEYYYLSDESSRDSYSLDACSDDVAIASSVVYVPQNEHVKELTSQLSNSWIILKQIPRKSILVTGFIIVLVSAVISPVFSFVFSRLLTGILPSEGVNVTLWALLVLLIAVLDGVFTYLEVILAYVATKWAALVRDILFQSLLLYPNLSKAQTSYFTKLLVGDIDNCTMIITTYWSNVVKVVFLGLVGIIWSLATGWKLTLVAISLMPLLTVIAFWYKRISNFWATKRERNRSFIIKLMDEIINEFKTVKNQHLEGYFQGHYNARENDIWRVTLRMIGVLGAGYGLIKVFVPCTQGLILFYGMKLISRGEYTISQTMLVFTMTLFTLLSLDSLTRSFPEVSTGFDASYRLQHALRNKPVEEQDDIAQDAEKRKSFNDDFQMGSISFDNVIKCYQGVPVLRGLSFDLYPGNCLAIVGPSGSGKSTITRLLEGLETVTKGRIYIDNSPIELIPKSFLRRRISVAQQMPIEFFPGTVMENLKYGLSDSDAITSNSDELIMAECYNSGIVDFIDDLEDGFYTYIKPGMLSGGQTQRLGIIRSLLRRPEVLILDECTSALDSDNVNLVKDLVQRLLDTQNITVIIITHQMEMASIAQNVLTLT